MSPWDAYAGKKLFLTDSDLQPGKASLSLYEAAADVDPSLVAITIHRPPNNPCVVSVRSLVREGDSFVAEAQAGPGSQVWYRFALLKEIAAFDRASGQITPFRNGAMFGILPADSLEVSPDPGLYYVTAQNDDGKTAFLLGPFARHIDALLRVARASMHLRNALPAAAWYRFGTSRIAGPAERQEGRLNVEVLTADELALLVPSAEQDATLPDMCYVFNPDAKPGEYVRAVRRGESGHYATTFSVPDPDSAKALVARMNAKLGVSDEEVERMHAGSMFGWRVPAAKPEAPRNRVR